MELNLFFVIIFIEVEKIIYYFSVIYVCIIYGFVFELKKNIIKYYISFNVCFKLYELIIFFLI